GALAPVGMTKVVVVVLGSTSQQQSQRQRTGVSAPHKLLHTCRSHCAADFVFPPPPSNSSANQCCSAVMFWGRPKKFFTRSFADMEPPGSRIMRRYFMGASPASR